MTKTITLCLLLIAVFALPVQTASAAALWDQPSAALAQQISDILGPGPAHLTIENKSSIATSEIPKIRRLLELDLKAHGVTASGADSASTVRVTLSESLRERLWVAEIIEGDRTQVTMVDLGPVSETHEQAAGGLLLRAQTVLALHAPALAVLEVPSGLLVLEPEQIDFYARAATGWQSGKNASLPLKGALTRDPRGVLLATNNGQNFDAWLNGTQCTGPLSIVDPASGWAVECRASDDPWPIASDANGTPELKAFYNSSRDYFTGVVSPASSVDLPPFYTASLVPRPAGGAALLIAGVDGKVQLVENGALWPIAGTRDWGSDLAVLHSGCGAGTQVIASGSGEAAHDSLRAYELPALEAIPASAPLAVDGTVTALWSAPEERSVYAVIRNTTDQYEVDRVTALCN